MIKDMVAVILHFLIYINISSLTIYYQAKYVTMVWYYITILRHFNNFNSSHHVEVIKLNIFHQGFSSLVRKYKKNKHLQNNVIIALKKHMIFIRNILNFKHHFLIQHFSSQTV